MNREDVLWTGRAQTLPAGFDIGQTISPIPNAAVLPPGVDPKTLERPMGGPAEIFRETLLSGGLPGHVVEGIMMNGHDESGFNPSAVGDNGNAFGILQWNGPRMRALKNFAAAQGADWSDPAIQAKFALYELQGPERGAYEKLLATTTPGEAGAVFVNHYERPAETHRARREAAYLGGQGVTVGGVSSDATGGNDRNPERLAWAYANGRMTPEDAAIYERGMAEGAFPKAQKPEPKEMPNPMDVYAATAMRQRTAFAPVALTAMPIENATPIRPFGRS